MTADGPLILGIESSCDETAASVVRAGVNVLSTIIATQHDLHARYAGVVPEIASRAHIQRIVPVLRDAMREADVTWADLDAIAVGHRPGLIGSLLVGVSAAKALAWSLGKPVIGVDHIAAHLHAGLLDRPPVDFPALGLVVSGGHTSIFHLRDPLDITLLGRTIDDAVGEAFDKAATILGLDYPGGPNLDALAQRGDDRAVDLPIARLSAQHDDPHAPPCLDFSFSGLKTAFLYAVRGRPVSQRGTRGRNVQFARDARDLTNRQRADYAASFQRAAIDAVMQNVQRAVDQYPVPTLLVGGGVSANSRLRRDLVRLGTERRIDVRLPEMRYCLDNAAMIAGYAAARFGAGQFDDLTLAASTSSSIAAADVHHRHAEHR